MPHRRTKPDLEVPTLRRVLLVLLSAALLGTAITAYVDAYRAQVLAAYIQRKTQGIQEPGEVDAVLDSIFTARMLAETPPSIGVDSATADTARRAAIGRVGVAAFDRADLLDRIATALTILLGVAVAATIGTWKPRRRTPRVDVDPMIETLAAQLQPRQPTPPRGEPATRRLPPV